MSATADPSLDAFLIPLRDCTAWCEVGDGHGHEHPDDRFCWSTYRTVPLTNPFHKPDRYDDGLWRMPYLNVLLRRLPESETSQVIIHSEETDKELRLSRAEALTLLEHLTELIDQMEKPTG